MIKAGKPAADFGLSYLALFDRTLDAMPGMKPEINVFSKHLQWLNYAEMARTAAAMVNLMKKDLDFLKRTIAKAKY